VSLHCQHARAASVLRGEEVFHGRRQLRLDVAMPHRFFVESASAC
jgi:hypothetical protein